MLLVCHAHHHVKLNTNGGFKRGVNLIGIGAFLRNDTTGWIAGFSNSSSGSCPLHAELLTLKHDLLLE